MNLAKRALYIPFFLGALTAITGCEREVYTSWSCNSQTENKIPMVLRKAQMEFKESRLDYCGSLGNQSYFDQRCPAQIGQSNAMFTPSSGALVQSGQEYQCTAL